MADARHRAISSYLHTASRAIINRLVQEGIGTLVIGKNDRWKQRVHMGNTRNQCIVCLQWQCYLHYAHTTDTGELDGAVWWHRGVLASFQPGTFTNPTPICDS